MNNGVRMVVKVVAAGFISLLGINNGIRMVVKVVVAGFISLLGVDIISERNGLIGPNAGHPMIAGQQKIHFRIQILLF